MTAAQTIHQHQIDTLRRLIVAGVVRLHPAWTHVDTGGPDGRRLPAIELAACRRDMAHAGRLSDLARAAAHIVGGEATDAYRGPDYPDTIDRIRISIPGSDTIESRKAAAAALGLSWK